MSGGLDVMTRSPSPGQALVVSVCVSSAPGEAPSSARSAVVLSLFLQVPTLPCPL